jgi:hypothetical protein
MNSTTNSKPTIAKQLANVAAHFADSERYLDGCAHHLPANLVTAAEIKSQCAPFFFDT